MYACLSISIDGLIIQVILFMVAVLTTGSLFVQFSMASALFADDNEIMNSALDGKRRCLIIKHLSTNIIVSFNICLATDHNYNL